MALVVVKVLPDLPQAQVAASVLRAAGFHPVLMDADAGSILWTMQFAFGGFRLCVPEDEAANSAALLASAVSTPGEADEPAEPRSAGGSAVRAAAGLGLALTMSVPAGWLAARRRGLGSGGWLAIALSIAVLAAVIGVLTLIGRLLHR